MTVTLCYEQLSLHEQEDRLARAKKPQSDAGYLQSVLEIKTKSVIPLRTSTS
jgi:hypothetical protein